MNNTGSDQPAHPGSLISTFVIRLLESIISILATSKISNFYLVSVAEETGLNYPEDRFSRVEVHISISIHDFGTCADPESFVRGIQI